MNASWAASDLASLAAQQELDVGAPRADGSRGRWTPIWVVVVADEVFVRTWQRRTTGWYGHAVAAGRAWIHLAHREVEVAVTLVADGEADDIDAAYTAKYSDAGSGLMITEESQLSTLRLDPA